MRPLTFSFVASFRVHSFISWIISGLLLYGGKTAALSPEWIPAASMCCNIPPIYMCLPSEIASRSYSNASSKNWSTSTGLFWEISSPETWKNSSKPAVSYAINIHLPPRTKDGRSRTGKPISSAFLITSSLLTPILFSGCLNPSSFTRAENSPLSSVLSMLSSEVPTIWAPAASSSAAMLSGVCPPSWTTTLLQCSFLIISITSSLVKGEI